MSTESVDDIMARCPLKHEIRSTLWAPFVQRMARPRKSLRYLTLYSPPMMDIKHLHKSGLIPYDGEKFGGVVAVTYVEAHYSRAMAQSGGRPELLLYGDINELMTSHDKAHAKHLQNAFPFHVVNLDYTNSLFGSANRDALSEHFAAIDEVIRLQHKNGLDEFVLLLTTRAERSETPEKNQFSDDFLSELVDRIDQNIRENPEFAAAYTASFAGVAGGQLMSSRYESFVPIGIAKLIAQMLSQHSYQIEDAESRVVVRDRKPPERWILHFAFHIKVGTLPRATELRRLGNTRAYYFERRLAPFIRAVGQQKVQWIRESCDHDRLWSTHGSYVSELAKWTLDLDVPEPTSSGL